MMSIKVHSYLGEFDGDWVVKFIPALQVIWGKIEFFLFEISTQ